MDEARRRQIEALRRLGPAGRLRITLGMTSCALACHRRQLRRAAAGTTAPPRAP